MNQTNRNDTVIESLITEYRSELLQAVRIRLFEEHLLDCFKDGLISGTIHTCSGQELAAVLLIKHLEEADYLFSNHRCHGHYLASTGDYQGLLAEVFGSPEGVSRGLGGSQHLHRGRFFTNGVQAGMSPIAGGVAYALKNCSEDSIAVACIGDGTFGEGVLYETFNLASKWQVPLLFVVENNGYAQSTHQQQTMAGSIEARAEAFGIQYYSSDTWSVAELDTTMQQAVTEVRTKQSPALIEVTTYRLNAHSKGDDNRCEEEVKNSRANDIVSQLLVDNAFADEQQAFVDKLADMTSALRQCEDRHDVRVFSAWRESGAKLVEKALPTTRVAQRITQFLHDFLDQNDTACVVGEDIEDANEFVPGEYGGAFKITAGLSTKFPGRVRNTPISEAAVTGWGIGMALAGMKPIVEIMFGDFCTLIADQILQHAAKIPHMYGTPMPLPFIVRTPMGARRGYGPTHSQSLERLFAGVEDLRLVALNDRTDPYVLYSDIVKGEQTIFTLVVENKCLYAKQIKSDIWPGYSVQYTEGRFPATVIAPKRHQAALTIFTYGEMLGHVEEAVKTLVYADEIFCEIVCPSELTPLDISPVLDSVARTGRILTVEEGNGFNGIGSAVVSRVASRNAEAIKWVGQLSNDTTIPAARAAEDALIPNCDSIVAEIRAALGER